MEGGLNHCPGHTKNHFRSKHATMKSILILALLLLIGLPAPCTSEPIKTQYYVRSLHRARSDYHQLRDHEHPNREVSRKSKDAPRNSASSSWDVTFFVHYNLFFSFSCNINQERKECCLICKLRWFGLLSSIDFSRSTSSVYPALNIKEYIEKSIASLAGQPGEWNR